MQCCALCPVPCALGDAMLCPGDAMLCPVPCALRPGGCNAVPWGCNAAMPKPLPAPPKRHAAYSPAAGSQGAMGMPGSASSPPSSRAPIIPAQHARSIHDSGASVWHVPLVLARFAAPGGPLPPVAMRVPPVAMLSLPEGLRGLLPPCLARLSRRRPWPMCASSCPPPRTC